MFTALGEVLQCTVRVGNIVISQICLGKVYNTQINVFVSIHLCSGHLLIPKRCTPSRGSVACANVLCFN